MITREEYLTALDVVEAYHRQIGIKQDVAEGKEQKFISVGQKGDFIVFSYLHKAIVGITVGKQYRINRVFQNHGAREVYVWYTIIRDDGKRKQSTFDSCTFKIIPQ